ncbi:MAG: hypothetical protein ACK56I_17465, partial [bacterium]
GDGTAASRTSRWTRFRPATTASTEVKEDKGDGGSPHLTSRLSGGRSAHVLTHAQSLTHPAHESPNGREHCRFGKKHSRSACGGQGDRPGGHFHPRGAARPASG